MSTDKDFYQLLSHRISVLNTQRRAALIRHQWDDLILWRTLIQLRTDIPLPTTTETHQSSSLPPAPDIIRPT